MIPIGAIYFLADLKIRRVETPSDKLKPLERLPLLGPVFGLLPITNTTYDGRFSGSSGRFLWVLALHAVPPISRISNRWSHLAESWTTFFLDHVTSYMAHFVMSVNTYLVREKTYWDCPRCAEGLRLTLVFQERASTRNLERDVAAVSVLDRLDGIYRDAV